MAEYEYKRLTRTTARGFVGLTRASLWLGNDHLLCVETTGYSEIYKRFYFRDIEAIVVRASKARTVFSITWGIVIVLFLFIGLAIDDTVGKVIFLSVAGVSALALVVNFVRGPTCTCEIRTLVQTERLPLSRIRATRKFLERVRPLIVSAQGELTPEEVAARMSETPIANPVAAAPAPAPAAVAVEASPQSAEAPDAPPPATS
jgi:hypothetical protein